MISGNVTNHYNVFYTSSPFNYKIMIKKVIKSFIKPATGETRIRVYESFQS